MSWFQRTVHRLAMRAAKYAGIPLRDPALVALLGTQPTAAGVDVDNHQAMTYSAVWQATNIIASNIAAMPPVPYVLTANGRREAEEHWSHDLLLLEPNPEMTPFTFYETVTAHALTWGNGYGHLERDDPEAPVEAMWPLMPNQVTPERDESDGRIVYRFQAQDVGEKDCVYESWEILHVPGLGFDGLKGYNVIEQARESIGLGAAMEKYGSAFFGRGSVPGGVLEVPAEMEMTEKARKNLRESFELLHRGPDNAHRVGVLEDGITYKPLGLPPETAQFLQSRAFQIVEIARWFNLPPHLLRDLTHATFSNIEHQGLDFLIYTLRPWLIRWTQEIRRKVFSPSERKKMCVEHNTHNLLMTDIAARYQAYRVGREGGWLTLNDILRREGLNPIEGVMGDSRIIPANMRAVNDLGQDLMAKTKSDAVANTAMNGPQIAALIQILTACAAQTIAPDSAAQLIRLAFPTVGSAIIDGLLQPIREGKVHAPQDGGTAPKPLAL